VTARADLRQSGRFPRHDFQSHSWKPS
jgi:hypothetical protein